MYLSPESIPKARRRLATERHSSSAMRFRSFDAKSISQTPRVEHDQCVKASAQIDAPRCRYVCKHCCYRCRLKSDDESIALGRFVRRGAFEFIHRSCHFLLMEVAQLTKRE